MIDRELIAMVDCPEIQDRWERKDGDKIYGPHPEYSDVFGTRIIWNGLIPDSGYHNWNDYWDEPPNGSVYIPRIEDVLEWLGDKFDELRKFGYISSDDIGMYAYCVSIDFEEQEFAGHTPIEALLKAYMHLEHSKTWNGEAWKEAE